MVPIVFQNFEKTNWITAIIWIVTLLISLSMMMAVKEEIELKEVNRKSFKILDRVVASLTVSSGLLSPMLLYTDKFLLFFLAVLGLGVGMYFVDIWLFNWYLTTDFGPTPEEIEAQQRREERRARRRNSMPARIIRGTTKGVFSLVGRTARLAWGATKLTYKAGREAADIIKETKDVAEALITPPTPPKSYYDPKDYYNDRP